MPSLPHSQLTLQTPEGTSIVSPFSPRCPNCKKRGAVAVLQSDPVPEGRRRVRLCKTSEGGCGYMFETITIIPDECPHCGSFDGFGVKRTVSTTTGFTRTHRCRNCKKTISSRETFPVPEDKLKRPHALIHNS